MHALVRGLDESRSTASRSVVGMVAAFSAGGDPRSSSAFRPAAEVCFLGDSESRSTLGCSYTTFFRPAGVESRCWCCALVGVFCCDCLLSSILSSFLPLWWVAALPSGGLFSAGDPRLLLLLPAVVVVVAALLLLLLLLSNTLEISPPVLPAVCVPGTPTPAADDR